MILFDIHHENAFFFAKRPPVLLPFCALRQLILSFFQIAFFVSDKTVFHVLSVLIFHFRNSFFPFSGLKIVAYTQLSRPFVFSLFPVIFPVFWR